VEFFLLQYERYSIQQKISEAMVGLGLFLEKLVLVTSFQESLHILRLALQPIPVDSITYNA
jgi:hypothetical protein